MASLGVSFCNVSCLEPDLYLRKNYGLVNHGCSVTLSRLNVFSSTCFLSYSVSPLYSVSYFSRSAGISPLPSLSPSSTLSSFWKLPPNCSTKTLNYEIGKQESNLTTKSVNNHQTLLPSLSSSFFLNSSLHSFLPLSPLKLGLPSHSTLNSSLHLYPMYGNSPTNKKSTLIVGSVIRKKGQKSEEVVRKEIAVVMIQLSKLTPQSAQTLGSVIKKYARKLGPECALGTLWELIRRGDWRRAIEAFDTIRNLEWYQPDPMIYCHLITLTGKVGEIQISEQLFGAMERQKCPKTTPVCTAMADTYGRHGRLWEAMKLFEEMKESKTCPPDEVTYSAVMRALCRSSRMREAELLLAEMPQRGCLPTDVTYNILIDGYGRSGDIINMQTKFVEMLEAGWTPDTWTYNALIRSFGKWGQIENMEVTFENMQHEGSAPDHFTFNALIDSYGKWGHLDKMKHTLRHMIRKRYRLGNVAFNAAIDAYGKAGRIQDMENCLREMRTLKLKPNQITFCSIIHAYGKKRMVTHVTRSLHQMTDLGVKPDVAVYNAVIDAYGENQAFDMVERVWKGMGTENCAPDAGTYSSLISAYANGGFLNKMEYAYKEVKLLGVRVSVKTLKTMMAAYAKLGLPDKLRGVWTEFMKTGEKPGVDDFNQLILACSRANRCDEMEIAFSRMRSAKCQPDDSTLQILVEGFATCGRIELMEKNMNLMKAMVGKPSVHCLSLVIGAYGRAGKPLLAKKVFDEILMEGLIPDPTTYSTLLIAQGRSHLLEDVSEQLLELEAGTDISRPVKSCASLLWILSVSKNWRDADEVMNWMSSIHEGMFLPLVRLLKTKYEDSGAINQQLRQRTVTEGFVKQDEKKSKITVQFGSGDSGHDIVNTRDLPLKTGYMFKAPLENVDHPAGRGMSSPVSTVSMTIDNWSESSRGRRESLPNNVMGNQQSSAVWKDVHELFDRLGKNSCQWRPFYDALISALWNFGLGVKSRQVLDEAQRRGTIRNVKSFNRTEWILDIHLLRPATAIVALLSWLEDCQMALGRDPLTFPTKVYIYHEKNGISMNNVGLNDDSEVVEEPLGLYIRNFLQRMGPPFLVSETVSGRFECDGIDFCSWLRERAMEEVPKLVDSKQPSPGYTVHFVDGETNLVL